MGRAAGDGQYYEVVTQVRRQSDGKLVGLPVVHELPSVTTILKALYKGGLDWWGHKIGVTGALDLIREGKVDPSTLPEDIEQAGALVYEQVKAEKRFTPYAVMTKAGGRGSDVHHIAEYIIDKGHPPSKASIPEEQHGYVKGLWDWYQKYVQSGLLEIEHSEIPCWSLTHGYAGTLDVFGRADIPSLTLSESVTDGASSPTVEKTVKRPVIVDFKTNNKGEVYESHELQTTAYGAAVEEMGICDEMPVGFVVAISHKGAVKMVESRASLDDFLAVKRVWDAVQRLNGKGVA